MSCESDKPWLDRSCDGGDEGAAMLAMLRCEESNPMFSRSIAVFAGRISPWLETSSVWSKSILVACLRRLYAARRVLPRRTRLEARHEIDGVAQFAQSRR